MKVLYLTKYSRNGASSRLRSYQYFPFLEAKGMCVSVSPFFDEAYLTNLYSGKRIAKRKIFKFYLKRFFTLFSIYKYDKIVIEKEIFPYFFSWFEKILWLLHVNYIVDYDDAIFHNYDLSNSKLILFFLKNKIDNVMKYSGCVVAGNDYLAQRATASGAKNIVIQPTVIDIRKYFVEEAINEKVVIGWIGSPSTFKYIKNIKEVFVQLFEKYDIELHVVGAKEAIGLGSKVKYIEWTEETEVSLISKFDIGIMPLENTPWEQGKCSYKLIQYMGCGLPVVASGVGMNTAVVENGINGFLATTVQEWQQTLEKLILDEELRQKLGDAGRRKVVSEYNLQQQSKLLISVLNE